MKKWNKYQWVWCILYATSHWQSNMQPGRSLRTSVTHTGSGTRTNTHIGPGWHITNSMIIRGSQETELAIKLNLHKQKLGSFCGFDVTSMEMHVYCAFITKSEHGYWQIDTRGAEEFIGFLRCSPFLPCTINTSISVHLNLCWLQPKPQLESTGTSWRRTQSSCYEYKLR